MADQDLPGKDIINTVRSYTLENIQSGILGFEDAGPVLTSRYCSEKPRRIPKLSILLPRVLNLMRLWWSFQMKGIIPIPTKGVFSIPL